MTPGRLTEVAGRPLADAVAGDSELARDLDRDLSLTQAAQPGADNVITAGAWWGADAPPGLASLEADLARKLDVAIGDTLEFVIAGQPVRARVTSFRKVDWDSFRPNFYVIFSPGTLADAPTTWLSSFRADDAPATVRRLRAQFPALTLIEIGPVLARMQGFVGQLADGIEFVLLLLLAATLLLLGASVIASLDERLAESALLRVLGARRRLLRATLAGEFALLGLVAGLLALLATELARWALYTQVMELAWAPLPALWLLLPLAAALLLAATGYAAARRSLGADAGRVLREG